MLDVLFNDEFSVRRLAGPRDGHGKATLVVVTEQTLDPSNESAADVPLFVDCYIDRRRRNVRNSQAMTKAVDATMIYNVGEASVKLVEEDLVVISSTGESYRVVTIQELASGIEGSEHALIGLTRTKAPVGINSVSSDEV